MDQAQEDYKLLGMTFGAFKGNEWTMKGRIGVPHADDPTPIGEDDKFYSSDADQSITAMMAGVWLLVSPQWFPRSVITAAGSVELTFSLLRRS